MPVILVVEDEKRIRQLVSINLKVRGYLTIETESAENALGLLHENKVDALLLDISLRTMSGWELLEAIQNDPTLPQIPVILWSASAFNDPSEYSTYPHIVAKLPKPLSVQTLLRTVSQIFNAKP